MQEIVDLPTSLIQKLFFVPLEHHSSFFLHYSYELPLEFIQLIDVKVYIRIFYNIKGYLFIPIDIYYSPKFFICRSIIRSAVTIWCRSTSILLGRIASLP